MSVLRFEDVTYTYPHAAAPALRDVSLDVSAGEFVVAAGLSASGKSTFLRAACGLVPHFHGGVFAGRVVTGGLDTREHGAAALSAVAGTLFQDPETQVVLSTVRAELALPLENRGHEASAVARGVEETALALGIGDLLDRSTHELSGGELQRVALGAALAGRPRLVLLDEPTSQLDPVAGDELVWLLRRLNEEWGTTIVLVEHRLERCLGAADRVLAFAAGRLACDAAPRGFLEWAAERAPALATPGARLFARAGLRPPPSGVKEARATLRAHGLLVEEGVGQATAGGGSIGAGAGAGAGVGAAGRGGGGARGVGSHGEVAGGAAAHGEGADAARGRRRGRLRRASAGPPAALAFRGVWYERSGGRAVLRGVDLALATGERVALMGRNGAGKSTLLRHANGLLAPTRGRVEAAGRVALLLQNPNDYFLADRVGDELDAGALQRAGLTALAGRHPRDLSGGERQRLALAIVCAGAAPPAALCLDEPTRGMDRAAKGDLAADLRIAAAAGTAVLVATHDPEFAALTADRVVLLADGRPIADGPVGELLSGGWYFATETARIVDGALLPEDGADLLRARMTLEVRP
ncbi:MAG TPA: ABC transporter ATP-binding protein [Solirubrobacteraceae bacterium]|jgi:energy-coupling factor transport system ATP-binding protein|nr:ABC transporter ATP-binding protein [Solirubrobacteraceae bacterium]